MDRQAYIHALKQAFLDEGISDCESFLQPYSELFTRRQADGCSEEEISSRLPNPVMIAKRYACLHKDEKCPPRSNVITRLCLTDAAALLLLLLSLACISAFFVLAVIFSYISVSLIFDMRQVTFFEALPYWGSFLVGVACLGFGVLCAVAAQLGICYCRRGIRDHLCWHRHFLSSPHFPRPPIHPVIGEKKRSRFRVAAKSAAIVSGLALLAAFVLLSAYTGYHPFWKDFGWF